MKKIFGILALLSLIVLFSCEKDEVKAVLNDKINAPAIISPSAGWSTKAITEENQSEMVTFKWKKADYGVPTVVTYYLKMDSAGRHFSKAVSLGSTTADSLSISLGELNDLMINTMKLPVNEESVLELQLGAFLNTPDTLVYHKDSVLAPISQIAITTWKKELPPPEQPPVRLWVPGAYQNWSPGTAPVISQISEDEFEGYVYMNVGDYFKFTSNPDWDHINYGDAGDGKLTKDGLAGGLKVDKPGFYKFNVNVTALTYTAELVETWGMIGTATTGAWDVSTPMTFDEEKNVWTKTTDLSPGALKFRANNGWGLNYGPADSNVLIGVLIISDAAIDIKEAGNYTITIDFSKSEAPFNYKYWVKKN